MTKANIKLIEAKLKGFNTHEKKIQFCLEQLIVEIDKQRVDGSVRDLANVSLEVLLAKIAEGGE